MKATTKSLIAIFFLSALFIFSQSSYAQRTLSGIITKDGKPEAGVSVTAKGKNTLTDFEGGYTLNVPKKTKKIQFECQGEKMKIEIAEDQNEISYNFGAEGSAPEPLKISLKSAIELAKAGNKNYMSVATYSDDYKVGNLEAAYPKWSANIKWFPKSTSNIYIHGAKILGDMISKASDETTKKAYLDTLMLMYDQRVKYFGEAALVKGRKGIDLMNYDESRLMDAYKLLKQSVEELGDQSDDAVMQNYVKATVDLYEYSKLGSEQVVDNFVKLSDVFEIRLKNARTNNESEENINRIRTARDGAETMFALSGAGTCTDLIPIFTKKYEADPENLDLLKKITKFLDQADCTDSELFATVAEKIYELEPSSYGAYLIAKLYVKKKDLTKAVEYYQKVINDPETDVDLAALCHYGVAYVKFEQKNYTAVKSNANKAIKLKPNWGNPYILIGLAYATGASSCGSDDFHNKTAYWAAVDKFIQAKKVDAKVEGKAATLITNYSKHFPNNELAFFHGLQEGQPFKIDCWINETTTVRVTKK